MTIYENGYPGAPANGYGSEHPNPFLREHIVLRHRDIADFKEFAVYTANGGYATAKRALTTMEPAAIIDEVKKAGLRGRGGAGFPTGLKWSFIPKDIFPKYLVCNADESEPGTFNNHEMIDFNPHQLIEGMIISGFAVGATTGYIYIRGEYAYGARVLEKAIAEAYAAGFLGKELWGTSFEFNLYVHRGAGAYICGEETALLEFAGGQDWPAAAQAAVPSGRRPVRQADRHQQCRDALEHSADRREGRGLVPLLRHRKIARHQSDLDQRPCQAAGQLSRFRWASRCASLSMTWPAAFAATASLNLSSPAAPRRTGWSTSPSTSMCR